MKKHLAISLVLILLTAGFAAAPLMQAHAQAAGEAKTSITADGDFSKAFGPVMGGIMSLFASLTGYAGVLLNDSVYYTVLHMGDYINKLNAVPVVWHIMRDLGNIILIFGFLAVGFTIIVGYDWYGSPTKMLPMLLITAVVLNFSLFVSEAVVDVGNVFASQFYTQINGGNVPKDAPLGISTLTSIQQDGISNTIMQSIGLQTLYNINGGKQVGLFNWSTKTMFIGFLGIILLVVAAFVMFSIAFILISRFVILIFLIILSPLGFAGMAVPQLNGIAKKWWDELLCQTFQAPVLLLMLYVALAVITDANFLGFYKLSPQAAANGFAAIANNPTGSTVGDFASILLSFVVAMGLLLTCTMLAKRMSCAAASWGVKTAGKWSFGAAAYGTSAVTGGFAFGARKGIQRYVPESNKYVRGAKRLASRGLRIAERAPMDIRNIPGAGAALGAAGAGEAATPNARSASGAVRGGVEWWQHGTEESNREYDRETRIPRLKTAINAGDGGAVGKILANVSDKELETSQMHKLLENPIAAAALPQARFDKLMTSESLSDDQKNHLREQRNHGLTERYTDEVEYRRPNTADVPEAQRGQPIPSVIHPGQNMTRGEFAMGELGNQAATQLPEPLLLNADVRQHMTIRQWNAISNSGNISAQTAQQIGREHLSGNQEFREYYGTRNRQQRADLRRFWHLDENQFPEDGALPPLPGAAAQPAAQAAPQPAAPAAPPPQGNAPQPPNQGGGGGNAGAGAQARLAARQNQQNRPRRP